MNNKFRVISIAIIIAIVGIVVFFIFTSQNNPFVKQAKEEIRFAETIVEEYQNMIKTIPALELSDDVKNDFEIEAAFFGMIGYINPGEEKQSSKTLVYIGKMINAASARSHPQIVFDMGEFSKLLDTTVSILPNVVKDDINFLERQADIFDARVEQAQKDIPVLTFLTVERNKKTEKYFLKFNQLEQQLTALTAVVEKYSSVDFRERLKKIKSANEIFGNLAMYTKLLIEGKAGAYSLEVAAIFSEIKSQEDIVKSCWRQTTSCKNIGPFPDEEYQVMFKKLESIYLKLIED